MPKLCPSLVINTTILDQVLYAAAWICGEFASHLERPEETLDAMLRGKINLLPGNELFLFAALCWRDSNPLNIRTNLNTIRGIS